MEKEYHAAKRISIAMYLFMVLAAACLIRCYMSYTRTGQAEWLLVAATPVLVAFIILPIVASRRVIISTTTIKTISLLGVKEISLKDVLGYQLKRIPKTMKRRIVIISRSTGQRLRISYHTMEDGEEILQFVQKNFALID